MAKLGQSTLGESSLGRPSTPANPAVSATAEDELTISVDSVEHTDTYKFYRAESSGTIKGDYPDALTDTSPSIIDSPLEDGERFFYRVTAIDGGSESNLSSEVDAITILPAATLSPPLLNSSGGVNLSWTNNDDSPDGGIDVEISTDDGSTWTTEATGLSPSTSTYTDSDVNTNAQYAYRIERTTDHTESTSQATEIYINGTSSSSGNFIEVLQESGSGTEQSSLTFNGIPDVLGSASATTETLTINAGHIFYLRDLFGPLESASFTAHASTNTIENGLATEDLLLPRSSTQEMVEVGLAQETALTFVTSSFLTLEGSAGAQPEIMRMGANSEQSVLDIGLATESAFMDHDALVSTTDVGLATESPLITSSGSMSWSDIGTATESPTLTETQSFSVFDTSTLNEIVSMDVDEEFTVDDIGSGVESASSTVRAIVRTRGDTALATTSLATNAISSVSGLEFASADEESTFDIIHTDTVSETGLATESGFSTGRGEFTADTFAFTTVTVNDIDISSFFDVDDRHVEYENGLVPVSSFVATSHFVDLPGRAQFVGEVSPDTNLTRREVGQTVDVQSPRYTSVNVLDDTSDAK